MGLRGVLANRDFDLGLCGEGRLDFLRYHFAGLGVLFSFIRQRDGMCAVPIPNCARRNGLEAVLLGFVREGSISLNGYVHR